MKDLLSSIILLLFTISLFAQSSDCSCLDDLDYFLDQLKKTPSYKEQIKGAQKKVFYQYVAQIKQEIQQEELIDIHCQVYLQKAMSQIKDAHLYTLAVNNKVDTPEKVQAFQASTKFLQTPKVDTDLNKLEKKLSLKSLKYLEGIYYTSNGLLKLGLEAFGDNRYRAIVLSSQTGLWKPGQIKFTLTLSDSDVQAIEYDWYHNGNFRQDTDVNRLLGRLSYVRDPEVIPTYRKRNIASFNEFEQFKNGITYLYIGSFKGSTSNLRQLDSMYLAIGTDIVKAQHLIIDVRDNGGGGQRAYNRLLDILDANQGKQKIHVMVNRFTGSAAEHFSLELKARGATIYGENTRGAINYRYSNRFTNKPSPVTPCFQYRLGLTVAKNPKAYKNLEREHSGITPDVKLLLGKDWVKQVMESINI